jgi:NAD(P)H-flavin reductase
VLKDTQDETSIRLVFANQTEEDILLRPELDAFALDPRFEVHYVLSRPKSPKEWVCGSTGRWACLLVTANMLAERAKQE